MRRVRLRAFRAEGLSLAEALPHAPRYLLKQAVGARRPEPGVKAALIAAAPPEERRAPAVRLGLLGDLMWLGGRALRPDPALHEALRGLDGLLGNLETPLDPGCTVPSRLPDYRTYNENIALIDGLAAVGPPICGLSVANNHALDRGPAGLRATVRALGERGVPVVGLQREPPRSFWLGGLQVSVAAACWGLNDPIDPAPVVVLPGLARARRAEEVELGPAAALLEAMPRGALRVLLLHWGHEFEAWPSAAQLGVARRLVALGADLIVGSHPHVVQPAACFPRPEGGRALVLFSLGNAFSLMSGWGVRLGALAEVGLMAPSGPGARPEAALLRVLGLRSRPRAAAVDWALEARSPWSARLAAGQPAG